MSRVGCAARPRAAHGIRERGQDDQDRNGISNGEDEMADQGTGRRFRVQVEAVANELCKLFSEIFTAPKPLVLAALAVSPPLRPRRPRNDKRAVGRLTIPPVSLVAVRGV